MKFNDVFNKILKEHENLIGGKADNRTLEDIALHHNISIEEIKKEYEMGLEIEKEHTSDENIASEIAKDHIFEFANYYTNLSKMEKKLEKEQDLRESVVPPIDYYDTKIQATDNDTVIIKPDNDFKNISISLVCKSIQNQSVINVLSSKITPANANLMKDSLINGVKNPVIIKSENRRDIELINVSDEINIIINKKSDDPMKVEDSMLSVTLSKDNVNELIEGLEKLI